jgi:8-oxo-dGTP pyrophosphatase MutT (NUDIX family)
MDFGESPHETLVREFGEETGLTPVVGALLDVHSRVYAANIRRPPLQVIQFVYEVRASGAPEVVEIGGSTAEAAWVRLADLDRHPLVDLATWALRR